jgi:hypothetical protein
MSEKAFFDQIALQAGAGHVHQAAAAGIPKHRLHQMVKEGSLRRCGVGIVAAAGVPETRAFNLMRAVLIGGYGSKAGTVAAIADITAAIALGMAAKPLEPIHVVSTRQINPKPGLLFHRATRLPPEEVVLVDGVPTTDPIRTFIDVCDSGSQEREGRRGLRLDPGSGTSIARAQRLHPVLIRIRLGGRPSVPRSTDRD